MQYLLILSLAFDLGTIKQEPNFERRSELALNNANTCLDEARDAYNAGDAAKMSAALDQVGESVDLSYQSLDESGKNPRSSKFFKRAELRTRELMRRIEALRETVGLDDRATVQKLHERVAEIHDKLLKSIMDKRK